MNFKILLFLLSIIIYLGCYKKTNEINIDITEINQIDFNQFKIKNNLLNSITIQANHDENNKLEKRVFKINLNQFQQDTILKLINSIVLLLKDSVTYIKQQYETMTCEDCGFFKL